MSLSHPKKTLIKKVLPCPACGALSLRLQKKAFRLPEQNLVLPALERFICRKCGEEYFHHDAMQIIEEKLYAKPLRKAG